MTKNKLLNSIPWLLVLILYFPIFKTLYRARWENIDYTHAYFILPVSLWLIWQARERLGELIAGESRPGSKGWLLLLAFGLLMFVFGWRNDYLSISSLSFLAVACGLTGYVFGHAILKAVSFPLLYLLFLVPPPLGIIDTVTLPMRYGASHVTYGILKLLHYPIEQAGLLLYMGKEEIFVGAPCSGFRSLVTLLALGSVLAYINKGTIKTKVILVASIIPIALVANVIRIIALCLITYHFGHEVGEGFFHYFSGALIFLVALAGLMFLETFLNKKIVTQQDIHEND